MNAREAQALEREMAKEAQRMGRDSLSARLACNQGDAREMRRIMQQEARELAKAERLIDRIGR